MSEVEQSVAGELERAPESLRGHPLAATAVLLARRLDAAPTDRDAASLSRELRLVLAELRALAGVGDRDMEEFLERVSTSSVRNS